jgi:DNA mismatch repair protein MutS2
MNELFKLVQIENSKRQKLSLKQKKNIQKQEDLLKKEVEKKVAIIRKEKKKKLKETPIIKPKPKRELVVGDSVRLEDGKTVGTIDKIEKNKAVVNYGLFTTSVNVNRLEYVSK